MSITWIPMETCITRRLQEGSGNVRSWNGRKRGNVEKAKGADKKRELSAPSKLSILKLLSL